MRESAKPNAEYRKKSAKEFHYKQSIIVNAHTREVNERAPPHARVNPSDPSLSGDSQKQRYSFKLCFITTPYYGPVVKFKT